jgi:hypothetical protein
MSTPDIFLFLFLLMLVTLQKFRVTRHIEYVLFTFVWKLFVVCLVIVLMIPCLVLGIDIASKNSVDKKKRVLRVKRKQLSYKRAIRVVIRPIRKFAYSVHAGVSGIQKLIREDEKRAKQRSIFNPFAYISIWTPIRSNFRLYNQLRKDMIARPRNALIGLRVGSRLAGFFQRLGK